MTVHLLLAISPILNDRVILVCTDVAKLNMAIDTQLSFARAVEDLCWMLDENQEEFLVAVVNETVGDDTWCEACEAFGEHPMDGEPCEAWDDLVALGFEPVTNMMEDAVADEQKRGFVVPEGLKQFWKNESPALAAFAKERAKKYAKEQASAVGITLEDAFFEDLFDGLFGGGGVSVPGTKQMSAQEAAKVLSIAWPCDKETMTAGFRKAVMAAHPDKGGSAEAFMRVGEARAVLMRALEKK